MAILKCKMCGGELTITPGDSLATCDYCGAQQTLPKVQDENIQNLFNRANVLRMKAEFDKASEIYEKILQSNGTEAEAYWGLILCKYGIEYVEDPATYNRVPTCHRASFDSVVADDDYKMAIQYADISQRAVYEAEAKKIDEIQKGILALAQKEEPYDVFICYKETDAEGKRTQDSVIANDIYYQLTQEGYKVFYAAITLEEKLGSEYEPCIFSALNSARVMLSIGTKPEYFNAVWVKNEWSRFLKIMKKDRARMLIPCYRDMDAYELPEEFAHLQAQDMSKIGFINDLVRGIKKVIVKENPNVQRDNQQATATTPAVTAPLSSNLVALLKRGNMALEDGEWQKADGFFEEALNQDAECAEAYWGKFLLGYECSNISEVTQVLLEEYESAKPEKLEACAEATEHIDDIVVKHVIEDYLSATEIKKLYEFDRTYESVLSCRKEQKTEQLNELKNEKLLVRAQQYAFAETKSSIERMMEEITAVLDKRITDAEEADQDSIASVKHTYEIHISEADVKTEELYNKAIDRREADYNARVLQMNKAEAIADYEKVIPLLKSMRGYKDSDRLAEQCQAEIERIKETEKLEAERLENERKQEEERTAKRRKKIAVTSAIAIVACVVVGILVTNIVKYSISKKELKCIASASVGEIVHFGKYGENTEWEVLAKEDNKMLIISRYVIGDMAYNATFTSVTWEKCTLRSWMNKEYINKGFNSYERTYIAETRNSNPDNPEYETDGGNYTSDKVFLLSIDEVNTYFTSDGERKTTLADGTATYWWLRSPGKYSEYAAVVNNAGIVYESGFNAYGDNGGVRPALWIDISDF